MKNRVIGLLHLMFALLLVFPLVGPVVAGDIPPVPHVFYGGVEIGTEAALPGTVVQAAGEGVESGESNPLITTVLGQYGGPAYLDGKLIVQGYIDEGTPIEFYVNGARALCREAGAVDWQDTYPWHSDGRTELDLWVDVPMEMDFGDAPDPTYSTLLVSNGARHIIDGATFLGNNVDPEGDGQPDATATGDDNDGNDDEDGIVFTTQLMPGTAASVDVTASVAGLLNAWIDFNADGDWADAGEQVFTDQPLVAGLNNLAFQVPPAAVQGTTYARFRFSTVPGLLYYGFAPDGEVEDYETGIEPPQDFGDTPDPTYPTLLASNGARHTIDGATFLGNGVDAEPDGQPDATATGDDNDGNDDEDGVAFTTALRAGAPARVDATASVAGLLNAWIDFNADGDWADAGEQIFADELLVAGVNDLVVQIPPSANVSDPTFARFRFSTVGGLSYDGPAPDGEVEDYQLQVDPLGLDGNDCGDAPDPTYPTLLGNNGAVHWIVGGVFLGNSVDAEADGQPDPAALGDDNDGNDDEDGVAFTTPLIVGRIAGVDVTASVAGLLNAWIDFNGDGDWDDPFEQIFADEPLVAGVNGLTFPVPTAAVPGFTISRFRFSIMGGLPYTGLASDGEVEDHQVEIGPTPFDKMDFVAFKPGQGTYVALSNGAGFDPKTLWSAQFKAFGTQDDNPRMVADVDADGRADVVGFKPTRGVWVALSPGPGPGFGPKTKWSIEFKWWGTQNLHPRMMGDVNGDGRADIVAFKAGQGVYVALSNGAGFDPKSLWTAEFSNPGSQDQNPRMVGDVDGDGIADIVRFRAGRGVHVALSNGAGFDPKTTWSTEFKWWGTQDQNPRMLADVNGDGLADIVAFQAGQGVYVALSNGAGFDPMSLWSTEFKHIGTQDSSPRMVGDVDADGRADLVASRAGRGVYVALSNGAAFDPRSLWSAEFKYYGTQNTAPRMLGNVDGS